MTNIKFNTGETVKVVQRTGNGMSKRQEDMVGTVHKIERVTGRGYFLTGSGYELWTDEMLELVVPHLNKNETPKERFFKAFQEMSVNGEFVTDGKETARITGYTMSTINTLGSKVRKELENEGKIKFEGRAGKHFRYSIVSEKPKEISQPKEGNKLSKAVSELEELFKRANEVDKLREEIERLQKELKNVYEGKKRWREESIKYENKFNELKQSLQMLIK